MCTNLAEKTELSADSENIGGFDETLKMVNGHTYQVHSPMHSADDPALLIENTSIRSPLIGAFSSSLQR